MPIYNPTGAGDVHVDKVLSDISIGFPQQSYVAHRLFPSYRVQKQSDKYYIHGREEWGPPVANDHRAAGANTREIPGKKISTDTYFAEEHALKTLVTDEEVLNADDPLDPMAEATDLVTARILLGRELAGRDLAVTPGNYATNHTVALSGAGASWDDYASSDPIGDVRTAKRQLHRALGMDPQNLLFVIPWRVMSFLEDHPDFIERVKYSERAILTEDIITSILGVGSTIIAGAQHNTAALGLTPSFSYIWSDNVILAVVPPRPGVKTLTFGWEFVWPINGQEQVVDRNRDWDRRGQWVRAGRRYDLKLPTTDSSGGNIAGYLISDTLSAGAE